MKIMNLKISQEQKVLPKMHEFTKDSLFPSQERKKIAVTGNAWKSYEEDGKTQEPSLVFWIRQA